MRSRRRLVDALAPSNAFEYDPSALVEYVEAYVWYAVRSQRAAVDFEQAVAHALRLIAEGPQRWQPLRPPYRKLTLGRRYPYALVYRPDITPPRIVALAHAKRREEYWLDREGE